jgi:hypothetical protein
MGIVLILLVVFGLYELLALGLRMLFGDRPPPSDSRPDLATHAPTRRFAILEWALAAGVGTALAALPLWLVQLLDYYAMVVSDPGTDQQAPFGLGVVIAFTISGLIGYALGSVHGSAMRAPLIFGVASGCLVQAVLLSGLAYLSNGSVWTIIYSVSTPSAAVAGLLLGLWLHRRTSMTASLQAPAQQAHQPDSRTVD